MLALIRGFLESAPGQAGNSRIRGVILNQATASVYTMLKKEIESQLPVRALGYVPRLEDGVIESRHLGLVTPGEIRNLKERLSRLAGTLEQTLDIDGILRLAGEAPELSAPVPEKLQNLIRKEPVRIAVARDEAFCFYYEDNLELLRRLGAEIVEFSPLHDEALPGQTQGFLIGGGYPELYAETLSRNVSMLASIREAAADGMPYLAECGGFMYLQRTMEDMEGRSWPVAGVLPGHVKKTDRLGAVRLYYADGEDPSDFRGARRADPGARVSLF